MGQGRNSQMAGTLSLALGVETNRSPKNDAKQGHHLASALNIHSFG